MIYTVENATLMYVASRTEAVNIEDIPFMFHVLGTNMYYLVTINYVKTYLNKVSEYFDGHWYYTNAGKVIRDVVAGNLPTEQLAITLLEGSSCYHVGDKLEFNTPMFTGFDVLPKIRFQSWVVRIFASYISMMYANKTKVEYNGLDVKNGGFILRLS